MSLRSSIITLLHIVIYFFVSSMSLPSHSNLVYFPLEEFPGYDGCSTAICSTVPQHRSYSECDDPFTINDPFITCPCQTTASDQSFTDILMTASGTGSFHNSLTFDLSVSEQGHFEVDITTTDTHNTREPSEGPVDIDAHEPPRPSQVSLQNIYYNHDLALQSHISSAHTVSPPQPS
jgi:hypothetical protein